MTNTSTGCEGNSTGEVPPPETPAASIPPTPLLAKVPAGPRPRAVTAIACGLFVYALLIEFIPVRLTYIILTEYRHLLGHWDPTPLVVIVLLLQAPVLLAAVHAVGLLRRAGWACRKAVAFLSADMVLAIPALLIASVILGGPPNAPLISFSIAVTLCIWLLAIILLGFGLAIFVLTRPRIRETFTQ